MAAAARKCEAVTTSGRRCKNNALPGSKFCYISAHQAQQGSSKAGAAAGGVAAGVAVWPFWKRALLAGGIALLLVIAFCLIPKLVWHMGRVTLVHEGNPENPVVIEQTVDLNMDGELDLNHDGFIDVDLGNPPCEDFKIEVTTPPCQEEKPISKVVVPGPNPGPSPQPPPSPTPGPPPVVYNDVPDDESLAEVVVCGEDKAANGDHGGPPGVGDEDPGMVLPEPSPGL